MIVAIFCTSSIDGGALGAGAIAPALVALTRLREMSLRYHLISLAVLRYATLPLASRMRADPG
ncbi:MULTISPECIES: hypothetical protein [Massilia]|uniref:hypothetical protein n=1 Tax=Massilia TaxID=149698 RepID=UPI001C62D3C2|nr:MULTISPECIES: hypothetical protein [Massilia]QYG02126.1 hypothetical protein KY496_01365 [Massilia sp. NP310]